METIVCSVCNGRGRKTCTACGGVGTLQPIAPMPTATSPDMFFKENTCGKCGGSGEIICPGCDGTGQIKQERVDEA